MDDRSVDRHRRARRQPDGGSRLSQLRIGCVSCAPSIVILVAYAKILAVVRQHHQTVGNLTAATTGNQVVTGVGVLNHDGSWRASVKSARSLFVICIAFYVTYLPCSVINVGFYLPPWYTVGARWIMLSSSLVNSTLYIMLYRSTRKNFRRMFCRRCGAANFGGQSQTENTAYDKVVLKYLCEMRLS